MKTIYKYTLDVATEQNIETFEDFRIRHVDVQNGNICCWGEIDTSAPKETKTIYVVGTGQEIPYGTYWVGTVLRDGCVWHVYVDSEY